ncbi:proton pump-interactor 1-like [Aristolochia californica]|uniref:proton pump-interactor 1-like n=1 Tax=Aristolochia californica TaxID=171875 RepID=UPI0035E25E96
MGVEILGASDLKDEVVGDIENGKQNKGLQTEETIEFGIVDGQKGATNGPNNVESNPIPDGGFPKDAVDEWPAPKQIHSFYFVRFRNFEDPSLRTKIEQADKELQKKNQARSQLTEALRAKKSDRAAIITQLKPLTAEDKMFRMIVGEKRKDMEPLQAALGKMRSANNAVREKGAGLCSSEEELNELIQSLHYRMQHESNTLVKEKQLLKEIKQLEGTREKVIANASMKAKLQDSFGQKEDIQDQLKLIGGDLDGVRKDQSSVRAKIKQLEEQLKAIESDINELQTKLTAEIEKRDKAYEALVALRKTREEGNACFYENRALLNKAKDIAAKKDIAALEELSHMEMEKFMALWSSSKSFRDDYEKRILPSLDIRQLSRDGRMRNPDEKSLIEVQPIQAEAQTAPVKATPKKTKEEAAPPLEIQQKESTKKVNEAETKGKVDDLADTGKSLGSEKSQKESSVSNVIDPEKLKEMKREEEIAKAKLAQERKKKLAEKAAAKAAIRVQKEAEKKLKDREKKAKKKVGAVNPTAEGEPVEEDSEAGESEKLEEKVEAPVITKAKEQKENIRQRNRAKSQDLPKAILRRKKSPSYWVWAVPAAAAVLVLILLMLAYYYFQ